MIPSEPERLPRPSKELPDVSASVPGLGDETTVTGTIQEGVEPGCLLVAGFLLIGSPVPVRAGQRVTVTGRVDPTIMTTCQQGTPLVVSSVTAA